MQMVNPVFVALDLDDVNRVLEISQSLKGKVGGFKLGPRLCMVHGSSLVEKVSECGPVFVDNKYFDIPNTMESAIRSTFEAGASFCTVHAQSGSEALKRMADVEKELSAIRPF